MYVEQNLKMNEFFKEEKVLWDTKVLATDISNSVLDSAQKGIYSNEKLLPLPNQWKDHYFKKYDQDHAIIIEKIRNEVIYRRFNLMDEIFPFRKKFHVIFCRNVMIYFDSPTKDRLIDKFYDALECGGYLFIGHSEWINLEKSRFKHIRPAVFRKE